MFENTVEDVDPDVLMCQKVLPNNTRAQARTMGRTEEGGKLDGQGAILASSFANLGGGHEVSKTLDVVIVPLWQRGSTILAKK